MTLPEMLDNTENGDEFAQVIQGLFAFLEKAKDEEND